MTAFFLLFLDSSFTNTPSSFQSYTLSARKSTWPRGVVGGYLSDFIPQGSIVC